MQIGGSFDLKNETGATSISLLADIGYYLQSFGAAFENTHGYNADVTEEAIFFNTLDLGTILKINMYLPNMPNQRPFSIGLGGGVKIPFSGKKYTYLHSGNEEIKENMSYKNIKETFIHPVIPYIKLTYDTYYYVSDKLALTVGAYMSYNFGMKYDVSKLNPKDSIPPIVPVYPPILKLTEYGYSSLTIGISFGISFGRLDPRPKE